MKLGASNVTVGREGCALTSFCMGVNSILGTDKWTPDKFVGNVNAFLPDGEAKWDVICSMVGGIKETLSQDIVDRSVIKSTLKNPKQFALLRVNHGAHFTLAYSMPWFSSTDVKVADPWLGKVVSAIGVYHDIDGVRVFSLT